MGYDNLIDWTGNDAANELMFQIFDTIRKEMRNGLNAPVPLSDESNTAGAINVALAIEAGVFSPFPLHWFDKSDLAFFARVKKGVEKEIKSAAAQKEWASPQEKREHLKSFKRMAQNMDRFAKIVAKASK